MISDSIFRFYIPIGILFLFGFVVGFSGFYGFFASLCVLCFIGYIVTNLALSKKAPLPLALAFAPVVGAGVCSIIEYLFRRPMFTVEIAIIVVWALVWFVKNDFRIGATSEIRLSGISIPIIAGLLAVVMGYALAQMSLMVIHMPHGGTDAWAIWNSHSRVLFRDGPAWASHIWNSYHADYPLLVPLMVARVWRYAGESPDLAGFFWNLFSLSSAMILGVVLTKLRGVMTGSIMALVLIGTPLYLQSAASQEADCPLSIFFLATIALICLHAECMPDRPSVLMLAGFLAGCAGWTKNEGVLFIMASCVVLLLPALRTPSATLRKFAVFAAGLALPLAVILFFKMTNATHNDLFENRHYAEVIEKIMNGARYKMIAKYVLTAGLTFGAWTVSPFIAIAACIALKGIAVRTILSRAWLSCIAILALVASGYFAIYVITPLDLQYHLISSLPRLMLQMWPSALLLAGLAAKGDDGHAGQASAADNS
jgi:hypothetical protein